MSRTILNFSQISAQSTSAINICNSAYRRKRCLPSSQPGDKLPSSRSLASIVERVDAKGIRGNDGHEIPLASLKRLKEPHRAPLPHYLHEIWMDTDIDHFAITNPGKDSIHCHLKLGLIPLLHIETTRRFSIYSETKTITFSRQETANIISEKLLRHILRKQLAQCVTTKDIFHVIIIALRSKRLKKQIPSISHHILDAFYRTRTSSSDLSIARKIAVLIERFEREGIAVRPLFFEKGLTYAMRSRDLSITKRFLWEYKSRGLAMTSVMFRRFIAKCSIGSRGYGEIRNGKWKRDELIQVLLGFPESPPGQEHHLELFLDRKVWSQYVHWLQILSRLGLRDELWQEWQLWKRSVDRVDCPLLFSSRNSGDTPKRRGDRYFIQMFIVVGDFQLAWRLVSETGSSPMGLVKDRLYALLEHVDLATVWNDELRIALLEKLDADLAAIEHFLGVEWISDGTEAGYHRPQERLREALEELSEQSFFQVYGMIRDSSPRSVTSK